MRMPSHAGGLVFTTSLLGLSVLISGSLFRVSAQQPHAPANTDTSRAIKIYQQGDAMKAVEQLQAVVKKRPNDADAWYYLGLVFSSQGFIGGSRRPFEQFVRLRPDSANGHAKLAFAQLLTDESPKALSTALRALELGDQSAESHYVIAEASLRAGDASKAVEEAETALRINPKFAVALITKCLANRDLKLYAESASNLEQYLALGPTDLDAESWREQLRELRHPIDLESKSGPTIFTAKEVTQKPRVLKKREPQYTETARTIGIKGTVVLRAVFSAEGEVKHIEIARGLGYGLNTNAIRAARQIRFTPAMKDGKPVSMFIQLEYNFNLY